MSVFWVMVARPFLFALLFALVIAPITWLLYRLIPKGKIRFMLFKDRTSEQATKQDKRLMTALVIVAYLALAAFFGLVAHISG